MTRKPYSTGFTHVYNTNIPILPSAHWYSLIKRWTWWFKRDPFRVRCPITCLTTGNVSMPVVRGWCARDPLLHTFDSGVLNALKQLYHNKIYLKRIIRFHWKLWYYVWHQSSVEARLKDAGDWHVWHMDAHSPLLHTRLLDTAERLSDQARCYREKIMSFRANIHAVV